MKYPLFSIIIPLYNEEDYIENLLNSLANQKFKNFEIIISDNNSTDNSIKKVNTVAKRKNLNIKIVKCSKKGISYARNEGAKYANGKYVVFFDADGQPNESWLNQAKKIFDTNEGLLAISSAYYYHTDKLLKKIWYNSYLPLLFAFLLIKSKLLKDNNLIGNNMVIRKDTFYNLNGFVHVIHEDIALSKKFNKKYKGKSRFTFRLKNKYSARRFEKHGYLKTLWEWLLSTVKKKSCSLYETFR